MKNRVIRHSLWKTSNRINLNRRMPQVELCARSFKNRPDSAGTLVFQNEHSTEVDLNFRDRKAAPGCRQNKVYIKIY